MPMMDPITGEWVDERGHPLTGSIKPDPNDPITYYHRGLEDPYKPVDIDPRYDYSRAKSDYEALTQEPDWTAGRIAQTIVGAPIRGVAGLLEELKGALGIPTIEDYAASNRHYYGTDPDTEPSIGDRFMGMLTGSSRREELAGLQLQQNLLRNQQRRKEEFATNKNIQSLLTGGFGLAEKRAQAPYLGSNAMLENLSKKLGIDVQNLGMQNTRQEMQLRSLSIAEAERQARVKTLIAKLTQTNPEIGRIMQERFGISDMSALP